MWDVQERLAAETAHIHYDCVKLHYVNALWVFFLLKTVEPRNTAQKSGNSAARSVSPYSHAAVSGSVSSRNCPQSTQFRDTVTSSLHMSLAATEVRRCRTNPLVDSDPQKVQQSKIGGRSVVVGWQSSRNVSQKVSKLFASLAFAIFISLVILTINVSDKTSAIWNVAVGRSLFAR